MSFRDPFGYQAILNQLKSIKGDMVATITALDDLKAAVARLNTDVAAELKAIGDKLSAFGDSVSATDVESAVTQINAAAASLETETKALTS